MSAEAGAPAAPTRRQAPPWVEEMPTDIDRWLRIEPDNTVTVFTGKVEVGQGIRASLAQAVADELRVAPASVRLVMGDTDLVPFDMGTFGSMTTPFMAAHLRRIAAAAREWLIGCAADRWSVSRAEVAPVSGQVTHMASGRWCRYTELLAGRGFGHSAGVDDLATPADEWMVAGGSLPRPNGAEIVTGRHRYPSDIRRPGMLYGKVLRPPAPNATLLSVDTRDAELMPNVRVVCDGDFVGVAAPDERAATRALGTVRATWSMEPPPEEGDLFEYLKTHPVDPVEGRWDGPMREEQGSMEAAFAAADVQLRQTYTVDFIAHAPLEPRAAVAAWHDGKLTVWTGTQRPFGVRSELAMAFGLDEANVRVIVPDTGSGYGGKHTGEAAREAALLARAAGVPVRVAWTREEEFTSAYFRPAGVIEIGSAAAHDGTLLSWDFHNYNSGTAGIRPPYDIPNQRLAFDPAKSPLRQGSYRALAATANTFARETHIDEMAVATGMDPLDFRLRNLTDLRLRAVLRAAAERFGWPANGRLPDGRGSGIAAGFEKGSYVATCAEVHVDGGIRVVRVVQAFECGAIVNPDGLESQVQGAIVQALGGALFERVVIKNGRIATTGFSSYRVPRFSDVPQIGVVLLDRRDLPSEGAGETPIIGLAPAVGNAIFAATGQRLRGLPLVSNGVTDLP